MTDPTAVITLGYMRSDTKTITTVKVPVWVVSAVAVGLAVALLVAAIIRVFS